MSFINGIVNAARSVIGLPAVHAKPAAGTAAPKRGLVAVDSKTGFDRTATSGSGNKVGSSTRTGGGPTLADRLAGVSPLSGNLNTDTETSKQDSSTAKRSTTIPPHLRGQRNDAPPRESSPLNDGQAGAASVQRETTQPETVQRETVQPKAARTTASARANIIDAGTFSSYGTIDNLAGGTDEAAAAAVNVQGGLDYYAETFGRDGIDGAGTGVNVLINDQSTDAQGRERFAGNGGFYTTSYSDGSVQEAIHFGRGKAYEAEHGTVSQYSMLHADDLAIHELTHGIIRQETGHIGGSANESGATNEAIADVMAAAATRDWRIGEGMYGAESDYKSMRNIAKPNDRTAIHGLYTTMNEINEVRSQGGEAEEHWASGVLSTAAYRMQQRIGGEEGWRAVEQVYYNAIDPQRLGDMSFTAVASGLRSSAAATYGGESFEYQVVDYELGQAGL